MLHPPRISILVRHLSRPVQEPDLGRRRALLGAILERKAAGGAFDLELLHHWLDVALTQQDDRALFGLEPGDGHAPPRATAGSARVSRRFEPEACNMKSIPARASVPVRSR